MPALQVSGLDGQMVAQTEISLIDGEAGRLIIRGRSLEQLEDVRFDQMLELLWGRKARPRALGCARVRIADELRPLLPWAQRLAPIEWLRLALDSLVTPTPEEVVAALSMALVLRHVPAATPDPDAEHVADVSRMLAPHAPAAFADGLRGYWVCVAEHGFNASTFTARVVASTGAPVQAALSAAIGALQGPLHGGAPGPVLDMLDELRNSADPATWLRARIERGERLMGFGHRVYKVRDPRAEMLQRACARMPGMEQELAFAARMESLATAVLEQLKPGRRLQTNVEYYTALLLQALGFDREAFTAVFACGRSLGWLAHVFEQQQHGRLIRPTAEYVGPLP